ncbi:MAG: HAD family hydrolase [Deltaproteobacteria bacterium]|nr:HAD family hydrolase [Deltaproteobacteria bacterium]MBW2445441.1 HAD family hydrolase [Deltaproteobacteria bacterium]
MKLLALDFDGVIADSAPECFTVACATWRTLEPDSPTLAGDADALREGFLSIMPLGNRAEDFGVALRILEAGARVESQADYDAFRGELDPAWLRTFHRRFYKERAALAALDRKAWLAQMGPYPEITVALHRMAGRVELAIATAKDRRTVRVLLHEYGLDALFPEDRVHDKETGANKASHMEALARDLGVDFDAITFVDDKLNHLDAVAPLGVRCVLAGWGYNGPREHRIARERGHAVCEAAGFEAHVLG